MELFNAETALDQCGGSKNEDSKKKLSFRFKLSLKMPEDSSDCPEFSYADLIKDAMKKKNVEKKESQMHVDGDDKERSDAEAMARYFEEKYGGGGAKSSRKRRRDRIEDLADVGYGYDETDPFVDNSECYDEVIPASMTTQFGGFYINSGKLEFKQVSDESNDVDDDEDSLPLSAHLKKKRKKSELFNSDENDFVESNGVDKRKKMKKRKDSMDRDEKRRRKISLQGKDKLSKLSKGPKKKHTKVQLLVAKAKAQSHMNIADKNSSSKLHNSNSTHRATTNGTTKATLEDTGKDLLDFLDDQGPNHGQKDLLSITAGDQIMNADNQSKLNKLPEDTNLPHTIPSNLKEKISSLTKIAKSNENEGKVKFFSPDVNHLLLGIEVGSQTLSSRERSGIYQHLTPHVPCSRDTLIKRMKKLHASKQDETLRLPLQRLKEAIDKVMTGQILLYDEECAAQQQAKVDDRVALAASTDEDDDGTGAAPGGEEKMKRVYAPRRKFKWTNEIRLLFFDVVKIKLQQFETLKNRQSQSAEDYLKNFLETEVKTLWPKGWMQTRNLYKESRDIHQHLTGQQAKQKKVFLNTNKKTTANRPEKKSTFPHPSPPGFSQSYTPTSVIISADSNKASKQLFKDTSISLNLSLDSDAVPEESLKQKDLMSRTINNAQKESLNHRSSQNIENRSAGHQRQETGSSKKSSNTKVNPPANMTSIEHPTQNQSHSLFKMLNATISANPKVKAELPKDDLKTLKVWQDASRNKNTATHSAGTGGKTVATKSTASNSSNQVSASKFLSTSTSKPQSKKSTVKSNPVSVLNQGNPQIDNFSAELLKLALLAPSGGPHMLPPIPYSPGLLPANSSSVEEFAAWMQLQQASIQSQLRTSPDQFQAYLSGMMTPNPPKTQFQYQTKVSKSNPKQPSHVTKSVSSSSTSNNTYLKDPVQESQRKQQRSHEHQNSSKYSSQRSDRSSSSTSSASDREIKSFTSIYPTTHSLTNSHSNTYLEARNSNGKKSTFSSAPPPLSKPTQVSIRSTPTPSSGTSRTYSAFSSSGCYPSSLYPSGTHMAKSMSTSTTSQTNSSKKYHKTATDANFIPYSTSSLGVSHHDNHTVEAILSNHKHTNSRR